MGKKTRRGPKNDKVDAFWLAEQLRIGAIETKVYQRRHQFRRLARLAKAYGFVVGVPAEVR